jgi:hypothetical protein
MLHCNIEEASFTRSRDPMMNQGYWEDCAEAMELTVEGNRLIALELAGYGRSAGHAVMRWLEQALKGYVATHRLPPI